MADSTAFTADDRSLLSGVVESYVAEGSVVGAELLVVDRGRTVLHEAFGWKDREQRRPMVQNTLFNIRSMTKPVVGTAAQMLIDEGRLALDAVVADYIPELGGTPAGSVTVEDLLTHRSGLPMSVLMDRAGGGMDSVFAGIESLSDLAALTADVSLDFPPGDDFQYSDAGSDLLGAVVSRAAGVSLERFVEQRILRPLGMQSTLTALQEGDARVSRVASSYLGTAGSWHRYWTPGDDPFYPFLLGSQGLYTTPSDYARFLALWLHEGVHEGRRLLSRAAIDRGLEPVSDFRQPTGFSHTDVRYGQMWTLYVPTDSTALRAFGHGGSDGTAAWAWPDRDLVVLLFTQSRGSAAPIAFERAIEKYLLKISGDVAGKDETDFERYAGTYVTQYGSRAQDEYSVAVRDGQLVLRVPQGVEIPLLEPDVDDVWRFAHDRSKGVVFESDRSEPAHTLWIVDPVEMVRQEPPGDGVSDVDAPRYAGTYTIRGLAGGGGMFTILEKDGGLSLGTPGGGTTSLEPDEDLARWKMEGTERAYVTFNENAGGSVTGLILHQFHRCRRGVLDEAAALDAAELQRYIGRYHDPQGNVDIEVIFDGEGLALKTPAVPVPLELRPPDAEGRWYLRVNPGVAIRFNEDEKGRVVSFTSITPMGTFERPRIDPNGTEDEANREKTLES